MVVPQLGGGELGACRPDSIRQPAEPAGTLSGLRPGAFLTSALLVRGRVLPIGQWSFVLAGCLLLRGSVQAMNEGNVELFVHSAPPVDGPAQRR